MERWHVVEIDYSPELGHHWIIYGPWYQVISIDVFLNALNDQEQWSMKGGNKPT